MNRPKKYHEESTSKIDLKIITLKNQYNKILIP